MQQWEYKLITQNLKGLLSKKAPVEVPEAVMAAGRDGWELVSTSPVTGGSYTTRSLVYVLKRPLPAASL